MEIIQDEAKRIGIVFVDMGEEDTESTTGIQIIKVSKEDQIILRITDAQAYRIFAQDSTHIMKHIVNTLDEKHKICVLPPFMRIETIIKHEKVE